MSGDTGASSSGASGGAEGRPRLHVFAFEEAEGFGGAFVDLAHIATALRERGVAVTIARSWDDPAWKALSDAGCVLKSHTRPELADRLRRHLEAGSAQVGSLRSRVDRVARLGLYGAEQLAVALPLGLRYGAWAKRNGVTHMFCNNGFAHNTSALVAGRVAGANVLSYQQGESDGSGGHHRLLPLVDHLFCVSAYIHQVEQRLAPEVAARSSVLYPGVHLPKAEDAAPRTGDGRVRVGMVGMLTPWKGQLAFIDAMAQVMAARPEVDGLLFGRPLATQADYPRLISERIEAHGLAHRFQVVSDRSRPEDIYPHLDISVHCSLLPEPFGRVVIEAMSFGRPVIAADRGGPREVVSPDVGARANPEDTESLAAAILRLTDDRDLRHAMGAAARAKVTAEFTYPAVLRPLMKRLEL